MTGVVVSGGKYGADGSGGLVADGAEAVGAVVALSSASTTLVLAKSGGTWLSGLFTEGDVCKVASSSETSETFGCIWATALADRPESLEGGRDVPLSSDRLIDFSISSLGFCELVTLSMPKPMIPLEARVLSDDLFVVTDLVELVGLSGNLSEEVPEACALRSVLTETFDCVGETAKESPGLEGSAALLRCQNRAGETGLLLGACASSRVLELVLVSLEETVLDVLLIPGFSLFSPSRLPRGLADVW